MCASWRRRMISLRMFVGHVVSPQRRCLQLRYELGFLASFPSRILHFALTDQIYIEFHSFWPIFKRAETQQFSLGRRSVSVEISTIPPIIGFHLHSAFFSSSLLGPARCGGAQTAVIARDRVQEESGQTHCLALTIPLPIVKRGSGIPELSGCDFKALSWEL